MILTEDNVAEILDTPNCYIEVNPGEFELDLVAFANNASTFTKEVNLDDMKHNMVCILESLNTTAYLGQYNGGHGSLHWSYDECLGPTKEYIGTPLYTFEQVMEVINRGIEEASEK